MTGFSCDDDRVSKKLCCLRFRCKTGGKEQEIARGLISVEKNGEQGGESSVCNLLDSEMFVLLISEIFFIFQKVLILKVLLMQKMILVLEMFVLLN